MRRYYLKQKERLLGMLLALLGVYGCSDSQEDEPQTIMYGPPTYHPFHVSGKVLNQEGLPIEDINVRIISKASEELKDTINVTTNQKGEYISEILPMPELEVTFQDVDGEKNGSYKDQTQIHTTESDSFYQGEWDINAVLEKKEDEQ